MAQLKPIDLKEVAQRFTKKYYPQWLHRFDRIWAMFEKLDLDSFVSNAAEPQYQQGEGFGIAGETDHLFKECISGIAIFAFTNQDLRENNINTEELRNRIAIVTANKNLSAGLQKKISDVLCEMMPLMAGAAEEQTENTVAESLEKDFFVYLSNTSGFGTKKENASEKEIHSKYLSDKEQYDLIIFKQNLSVKSIAKKGGVEKTRFKPIEVHANILHLLILFLKYKDENLPFFPLYHCAWKDSVEHVENDSEQDRMINSLKHAVSMLRKYKKSIKGFIIPNAKRGSNTYTCKGDFKFCLILERDVDRRYTIELN